jgi:CheY-like chemotaxis protein
MGQQLRVLHVEDDFADAMLVQHAVCESGDFDIAFEVVGTLKAAKRRLAREAFDLVLLDLRLPDSVDPVDTLESTQSCCGETPVLVLSGSMTVDRKHLPLGVAQLDKNKSFQNKPNGTARLAHEIREAAGADDTFAV